jgi:hypothetical protein
VNGEVEFVLLYSALQIMLASLSAIFCSGQQRPYDVHDN